MSNLEELPLNEYREYIKVQTDKGTEVATNLVILCNGIKINSSAYHSALGKQVAWPTSPGREYISGRLKSKQRSGIQASPLICMGCRHPKATA